MRIIGTTVYLDTSETALWDLRRELPAGEDYLALAISKVAPIVVRRHNGMFAKVFWPPDYPESERVAFTERFLTNPRASVVDAERRANQVNDERFVTPQETKNEDPGTGAPGSRAEARRASETVGAVRRGRGKK